MSTRMKSATTPMVDRLRAGGSALEMTNANRCALMLDAADVMEEMLEALKDIEEYGVRRRESHGDTLEKRLMDTVEDMKDLARAAIARAAGGES